MRNALGLWFVLLIVFISLTQNARADETTQPLKMSLWDALKMAKEKHVEAIVANERVNQAIARIGESSAPFLPQLSIDASQQRMTRDIRSSGISFSGDPLVGPFNAFDARVKVTQTLFDAPLIQRLKLAHDGKNLSTSQQRKTDSDVMALVATFFIEAKRANESVKLAKALLRLDEMRLRLAYSRYSMGITSEVELRQAKAAYTKSLFNWKTVKAQSMERKLDLTAGLGISPHQDIEFIWDDLENDSLQDLKASGYLEDQPELEVARRQLQAQKTQKAVEQAEFFPRISAMGDYGPSGLEPNDTNETYTMGVQFSMPIFEGGLRSSRVREAESMVKESEARLEDMEYQVEAKILSANQEIQKARAFLNETEAEMAFSREEFDLAKGRLGSGIGSELELIDAKARLAMSRDQKDEARANYVMSQINLAHALGKIDQLLQ